jgi:CBS domain containing-hemolysin-like protein
MANKIAYRYRTVLFALIMSASTALIVSGIIIFLRIQPQTNFIQIWFRAFITAWPIVFVAILIIAPLVNKLLNLIVEDH